MKDKMYILCYKVWWTCGTVVQHVQPGWGVFTQVWRVYPQVWGVSKLGYLKNDALLAKCAVLLCKFDTSNVGFSVENRGKKNDKKSGLKVTFSQKCEKMRLEG